MNTKKIMLTGLLLGLFPFITHNMYAANEMFCVEKDPNYGATTYVTKDGNPAPVGLYVERLASPAASALSPPTTNLVSNPIIGQNYWGFYTEPSLNIKTYIWGTTYMGDDDTGSGFPSTGDPGFVASTTESSSTEWYGWLRALSSTTFPTAVYYKDTTPAALLDGAGFGLNMDWDVAELPITNINPAYVIQFITQPYTSSPVQISGRVANIGNGNNQLVSDAVEVLITGTTTESVDITGDGSFTYDVPEAGDYVVQAYVPTASPRPGFPISDEITVYAEPEPALAMIILPAIILMLRKRS